MRIKEILLTFIITINIANCKSAVYPGNYSDRN